MMRRVGLAPEDVDDPLLNSVHVEGRAGIGPIRISNVPVDRRRFVRRSRDGGKSKRSKI
jgi:hypothetical protein